MMYQKCCTWPKVFRDIVEVTTDAVNLICGYGVGFVIHVYLYWISVNYKAK